jgi:hypothetical protein
MSARPDIVHPSDVPHATTAPRLVEVPWRRLLGVEGAAGPAARRRARRATSSSGSDPRRTPPEQLKTVIRQPVLERSASARPRRRAG